MLHIAAFKSKEGEMVALLLKHAQRAQSVAAPPWQCPSSAPAAHQGVPGGSERWSAQESLCHWATSHCLGCSNSHRRSQTGNARFVQNADYIKVPFSASSLGPRNGAAA